MKLADLITADNASPDDGPLDKVLVDAMAAFGFRWVSYRLARPHDYVGIITGIRKDGTSMSWEGVGKTPAEAEAETIDALARWIMKQQIGATP